MWHCSTLVLSVLLLAVVCRAAPTPLEDDATLNDITFVGSRHGWAVGDRGVAWRTDDGGHTWTFVPTPTDEPLRSACFLTDRIGWVAGGAAVGYSSASRGVLLFTRDAGATWQRLGDGQLPRLHVVRFTGLKEGVVVGTATPANPSGVFTTKDGGVTWQPVGANRTERWRDAAFGAAGVGVLVGREGRVALFAEGRLLESRIADVGLRSFRAASLDNDDHGWIVGDGGLVLRTRSGGVSWSQPDRPPAREDVRRFDLDAVAHRGTNVWMAGSPGSIVWHSPDGGRTWRSGRTGTTTPIRDLHFTDETTGFAVGAFGTILRTDDAGTTWQPVRGGGRRAAMLAIHAHPWRVSFRLLARESADRGYRSAVLVAARHDVGPDAEPRPDGDDRLDEAAVLTGAATAVTDWPLPLDLPNLDRNEARLIAEWNRRTEGRLADEVVGRLVTAIRTWRPNVLVLDDPPPGDEATRLINAAVMQAVARAGDPTRDLALTERLDLPPWRVRKVFARQPDGSTGDVNLEAYETLPRLGTPLISAAAPAEATFGERKRTGSRPEGYRLLRDTAASGAGASPTFFAGIVLAPGTEARRTLPAIDETRAEIDRALVQRQRNVHAYAARAFDDPRQAAGLLAQIDNVLRGMPDDRAAEFLLAIGREHRRRAQWDEAEGTFVELVRRYPDEPAGREAARWLFQLWTSTETAWQRARRVGSDVRVSTTSRDAVVSSLARSIRLASHEFSDPDEVDERIERDDHPDPWLVLNHTGAVVNSPKRTLVNGATDGTDWRAGTVRHWRRRAVWLASLLREKSPETFRSPEIQFPLATLYREQSAFARADDIHRRFVRASSGSAWQRVAEAEVWMLHPTAVPPRKVAVCGRTAERPHLDGRLADACWRGAKVVPLSPREVDDVDARTLGYALFAYDATYLYVAASLPRDPRLPTDGPSHAGRSHDADLTAFDRIAVLLDVDRDYATHYALEVDQRGWTRDACWEDRGWNPRWHVAAETEDGRWMIEAAIPFDELAPAAPTRGHVWALGLYRTKPALGVDSWTAPETARPRPETFGLLRFE